jgi:prolyl-tRNA synthetase
MMQDRKALQAGTSHFLGQNFAKASGIKFQTQEEAEEFAWTTSWGVSTRLIGGLIMAHGDDDGIILPPKISSAHVVLLPIIRKPDDKFSVMEYVKNLEQELKEKSYGNSKIIVETDDRETGGARNWEWIKKGIPLRVEIGPRDIAENCVYLGRRDQKYNQKTQMKKDRFVGEIQFLLDDIQNNLFKRALHFQQNYTMIIDHKKEFYEFFTPLNTENTEIHGGFAKSHWCESENCESKIKEDLSVTIRCIPFNEESETGSCIYCGRPSQKRAIFAKAY